MLSYDNNIRESGSQALMEGLLQLKNVISFDYCFEFFDLSKFKAKNRMERCVIF